MQRNQNKIFVYVQLLVLCLVTILAAVNQGQAQTYPARVATALMPPYSVYLNDYTDPASNNLAATLFFNDFNEPSWEVSLRIKVEGSEARIQTRPGYRPVQPIILTPGVPLRLSGADLEEYLAVQNIVVEGIDRQEFVAGGRLPEGAYSFCIEILDYRTGRSLSMPGCASALLLLQDPPRIVTPTCQNALQPQVPQRINFSWQLPSATATRPGDILYKLSIYEVTDPTADPEYALANGNALQIFEEEVDRTTFVYDASAPDLTLGSRYVFRVQATNAEGRSTFKNDGYSEPCWFYYGYPTGGLVALQQPAPNAAYGRGEQPVFRWNAPDNLLPGQQYRYSVKVVQLNAGQTAPKSLEGLNPWFETETRQTGAQTAWEYRLPQDLEPEYDYAWQVQAYSGEQLIAESAVSKFAGPALIEQFSAGGVVVKVKSTTNRDMNNLSGIALIPMGGNVAPAEAEFEGIKIEDRGGVISLVSGEIVADQLPISSLAITAREENNPGAVFNIDAVKVTSGGLQYQGAIEIPLSWATTEGVNGKLLTEPAWFDYSEGALSGPASLQSSQSFTLLEPSDFTLELTTDSQITLARNEYILNLQGTLSLPETQLSTATEPLTYPFKGWDNLEWLIIKDIRATNYISLANNAGLHIRPRRVIFDLSDDRSPKSLSANPGWKGWYGVEWIVGLAKEIDAGGQLLQPQAYFLPTFTDGPGTSFYIDGTGLNLQVASPFEEEPAMSFQGFPAHYTQASINIEEGELSNSHIEGEIFSAFLDTQNSLGIRLPLGPQGFQPGFLTEELKGKTITLAGDKAEPIAVTINNGAFTGSNYIELSVDIDYPYLLNDPLQGVSSLRVWGNGDIGIEEPNKRVALANQAMGRLNGQPIRVDSVAFGRSEEFYAASFSFGLDRPWRGSTARHPKRRV